MTPLSSSAFASATCWVGDAPATERMYSSEAALASAYAVR